MISSAPPPPGPPNLTPKHSGPRRSASRRAGRRQTAGPWARLRQDPALALVLLMALAVPLLPGPGGALPWGGLAGAALEAGGVLLLAAALWRADAAGLGRALSFLKRGPTGWLLGFAAWALLSAALASGGTAALQGGLALGAGLLVYATTAYRARREADLRLALDAVSAATLLVSLLALGALLLTGTMSAGAFTHRSFGAVIALLLPVAVLAAGAPGTKIQRGAGSAASVLGLLALLLSRWNPAERSALVAALVLGLACWHLGVRVWPSGGPTLLARVREARAQAAKSSRAAHPRGSRAGRRHGRAEAERRRTALGRASYAATVLVAAAVFLALTPDGGAALRHARASLARAAEAPSSGRAARPSFSWASSSGRLLRGLRMAPAGAARGDAPEGRQSTRAVLAMIAARPFLGWGLGGYALHQAAWTHQGDDEAFVRRHGPKAGDRARGAYWQIAAETGLVGLALWAAALAAFFTGAVRAFRGTEQSPLRRRVLIGCLAAVAGQAVAAYSDGSWQDAAPSLFLWLLLGLGAAAAGGGGEPEQEAPAGAGGGPGQDGWRVRLRFAGVCALCAVLLSLVVRASH